VNIYGRINITLLPNLRITECYCPDAGNSAVNDHFPLPIFGNLRFNKHPVKGRPNIITLGLLIISGNFIESENFVYICDCTVCNFQFAISIFMCRFYSKILFLNNSFILSKLCFGLWQMKMVWATQPSPLA